MALLIYSNGMDVRVATVSNDAEINMHTETGGCTPIDWEYSIDERKSVEDELRKENARLKKVIYDAYRQSANYASITGRA